MQTWQSNYNKLFNRPNISYVIRYPFYCCGWAGFVIELSASFLVSASSR